MSNTNQSLIESFDAEIPNEDEQDWKHSEYMDEVSFDLRGRNIMIQLTRASNLNYVRWVLEKTKAKVQKDDIGYDITFKTNGGINRGEDEFVIFAAVLKVLNKYFSEHNWDCLQFIGDGDDRNRVYEALAQRMTKTQPDVELLAQRGDRFVIARF